MAVCGNFSTCKVESLYSVQSITKMFSWTTIKQLFKDQSEVSALPAGWRRSITNVAPNQTEGGIQISLELIMNSRAAFK